MRYARLENRVSVYILFIYVQGVIHNLRYGHFIAFIEIEKMNSVYKFFFDFGNLSKRFENLVFFYNLSV